MHIYLPAVTVFLSVEESWLENINILLQFIYLVIETATLPACHQ